LPVPRGSGAEISKGDRTMEEQEKKYIIEQITSDNRRPGMPEQGYLVRYRLHDSFGWTGCRALPSLEAAESFAATLTPAGDLPGFGS